MLPQDLILFQQLVGLIQEVSGQIDPDQSHLVVRLVQRWADQNLIYLADKLPWLLEVALVEQVEPRQSLRFDPSLLLFVFPNFLKHLHCHQRFHQQKHVGDA